MDLPDFYFTGLMVRTHTIPETTTDDSSNLDVRTKTATHMAS